MGDIKVTKQKSTFECWVRFPGDAQRKAQDIIKSVLTVSRQNYDKLFGQLHHGPGQT